MTSERAVEFFFLWGGGRTSIYLGCFSLDSCPEQRIGLVKALLKDLQRKRNGEITPGSPGFPWNIEICSQMDILRTERLLSHLASIWWKRAACVKIRPPAPFPGKRCFGPILYATLAGRTFGICYQISGGKIGVCWVSLFPGWGSAVVRCRFPDGSFKEEL